MQPCHCLRLLLLPCSCTDSQNPTWLLQLARLGCTREQVDKVQAMGAQNASSSGSSSGASLYERQHLFSIYVHSPPDYTTPYENSRWAVAA